MRIYNIVILSCFFAVMVLGGFEIGLSHRNSVSACKPGFEARGENGEGPEGIGSAQDVQARVNFEMMRLVDPRTGQMPAYMRSRELAFAHQTMKTQSSSGGTGAVFNRRGPFNIGGRTRAFAQDIDNGNILLAGGVTGNMWRTTNGGNTYTQTTTPEQLHSITTIVQDSRPGKHNTWYYGTGEEYAVVSQASGTQFSGNGIYKSTDSGQSWQALPATVSGLNYTYNKTGFNYVWKVIIDPTDTVNDVVYAAVINGIYRSMDGGSTWAPILGLDTSSASTVSLYSDIVITPLGILYAYICGSDSASGIWRSADEGNTWANITPGYWSSAVQRLYFAVTPQDETKLMMVAYDPNSSQNGHDLWHYTYLSGDGTGAGGYWDNRTQYLPDFVCNNQYATNFDYKFGVFQTQEGYDMCMAISAADSNIVFLGGTDIFRSQDGFTSNVSYWVGGYQCDTMMATNYVYPRHHPDQHVLFFDHSNPDILFSGNDGGIYKTLDDTQDTIQWVPLNNGYMNTQFYAVAVETGNSTSQKVAGGMQDNGSWMTLGEDSSVPWINVLYGDGGYIGLPYGKNYAIAEWELGRVLKCQQDSNGNIVNWTRIDPIGGRSYLFIAPFILDPSNDNKLYLAAGVQLFVQKNLDSIPMTGDQYDSISTGWSLIKTHLLFGENVYVSALGMSAADSTRLYFGTSSGDIVRLDSLNGTIVETVLTDSIMPPGAYINSIWVNPSNAAEVIITFSNYNVLSIFHTSDYGQDWESIGGSLEQYPDGTGDGPAVFWVDVLNLEDSMIYFAATTTGLYSTTSLDGANTNWQQESPNGIGDAVVDMVKTRDYDGLVVAGTHGSGVFSTRYKYLAGIKNVAQNNLAVTASPDPFSSNVTFHYSLSQGGDVIVHIYDLNGNLITTLQDNEGPGTHAIEWDGGGGTASNGPYLYELVAGKQQASGKIMLMR